MKRPNGLLRAGMFAVAAAAVALVAGAAARPAGADDPLPRAASQRHVNAYEALLQAGEGSGGEATVKNPTNPICSTSGGGGTNVNTDCEGVAPHNETTIAVNPTNRLNLIGGANDYQLTVSSGGSINETVFSRAHVSFDGGKTWSMIALGDNGYVATGDPAVAFDAAGNAYYSTLGFGFGQGSPTARNPDILVAASHDGGRTWTRVRVANGTGSFGSVGILHDKPYIAAWGSGNAIVTWSRFNDLKGGAYGGSPIFSSVTHDGGATWSTPHEISGSAPFCIGFGGGTACNQDEFSVPTVAADGSIYIAFVSLANTTNFRDQYLVVKVDPQTGARVAGPFKVADLVDGITDTPFNAFGEPTLQDSQFRTFAFGNIAADPTNAAHLAVVWTDTRNSRLPAPSDPYEAKTNSDVIAAQSFDRGRTWSAATALKISNDQFQAFGNYGADGLLRIGFFDRQYDKANHQYGYSLATETRTGSLRFSTRQLTTVLSDPTQGDRWFSGLTVNSAFPHPTSFLGDYSGTAPGAALWTDLRNEVCFGVRCGHGEDALYASAP